MMKTNSYIVLKSLFVGAWTIMFLLLPGTLSLAEFADKPVVKIAFILPLSGDWAFLGTEPSIKVIRGGQAVLAL